MKKIIIVLLFLFCVPISLLAQNFEISADTINLDLKEICRPASRVSLTHTIKYNNKFYCFLKERGLYSFKVQSKYLLELSDKGKILNIIETPDEIQKANYFDFFVRNDSLLSKNYINNNSFLLDKEKMKWERIKEVDDQVYEDENYKVFYLDFGEFGESTWFIDKKTQKQYVIGTNGRNINYFNNRYILTSRGKITEILNPKKLLECKVEEQYEMLKAQKNLQNISHSLIGSKDIYTDSTYNFSFEKPIQEIHTSFVVDQELYHLYSDSISTFIGQIKNKNLVQTQDLNKKYHLFNSSHSYRGNNLENDYRFLMFMESQNTFGFIQIKNHKIDIKYIKHNIDSLKYLGSDNFEKVLNLINQNSNKLNIEQIHKIENEIGGIHMKTDRINTNHNGYYPKYLNSQQIKTNEFIKLESELIAQKTEYLYTISDKNIKSVFIEWSTTQSYNKTEWFDYNEGKNEKIKVFSKKQDEIIKIITSILNSKPVLMKITRIILIWFGKLKKAWN